MGRFGGFYKGERKRSKKVKLEKKAQALGRSEVFVLPEVEIIKKGKNER